MQDIEELENDDDEDEHNDSEPADDD